MQELVKIINFSFSSKMYVAACMYGSHKRRYRKTEGL